MKLIIACLVCVSFMGCAKPPLVESVDKNLTSSIPIPIGPVPNYNPSPNPTPSSVSNPVPYLFGIVPTGAIQIPQGSLGQYQMMNASSNDTLTQWPVASVLDGNPASNYSSTKFATAANDRGTFLAAWMGGRAPVSHVLLLARNRNRDMVGDGFPVSYEVRLTAPDNSTWNHIGDYSIQPDANGIVVIPLGGVYQTYGVLIVPKVIGVDPDGNHYFQMSEIQLAP